MFKAGFYEADITPPLYLNMGGYPQERLAETVLEPLYAKAAVFEQDGTKVAILCTDTCSVADPEIEDILARIEVHTDIKRENVLVCANHTHKGYPYFANNTDKTVMALREIFCCRAADSVILANQRLTDVKVKFGEEYEDTVAKNRDYLMKDGSVITNPGRLNPNVVKSIGNIDPALPVLYFENEDGTPKGAVISYACHQDAVGLEKGYSGDYASLIAKEMKKEFGEDFVCVFLLGCCGDINHVDVTREFIDKQYREMSEKLSPKVVSAAKNGVEMKDPTLASIKETVYVKRSETTEELVKDKVRDYLEMGTAQLYWIRDLIAFHMREKSEGVDLVVQCIKIGDCMIYALPGEIFVDFQLEIKEKSPCDKNIFATLSNCSCGYIPTLEIFKNPYSYEAIPKNMEPEAGVKITNKALEIAERLK